MKIFKPHPNARRSIYLVLFAFFFVAGCHPNDTEPAPEFSQDLSSARKGQSRGEELFRGIFLLEGEVAQKIEMYEPLLAEIAEQSKKKPGFTKERADYNTRLVAKINELDKGYLDRLAVAVDTKEYKTINDAVEHGALLIKGIFFLEMSEKLQKGVSDKVVKLEPKSFDFSKRSELLRFVALAKKQLPEKEITKLLKEDPAYNAQSLVAFAAAFVAVVAVWDVAVLINVAAAVNVVAAVFALVTVTVDDSPPTDEAPDDEAPDDEEDDDREEPGTPEEPTGPVSSLLSRKVSAPEKGNLKKELLLKQIAFDL